jgi:hypothetical protein
LISQKKTSISLTKDMINQVATRTYSTKSGNPQLAIEVEFYISVCSTIDGLIIFYHLNDEINGNQ